MGAKEKVHKWNVMALEFQLEFGVAFCRHLNILFPCMVRTVGGQLSMSMEILELKLPRPVSRLLHCLVVVLEQDTLLKFIFLICELMDNLYSVEYSSWQLGIRRVKQMAPEGLLSPQCKWLSLVSIIVRVEAFLSLLHGHSPMQLFCSYRDVYNLHLPMW